MPLPTLVNWAVPIRSDSGLGKALRSESPRSRFTLPFAAVAAIMKRVRGAENEFETDCPLPRPRRSERDRETRSRPRGRAERGDAGQRYSRGRDPRGDRRPGRADRRPRRRLVRRRCSAGFRDRRRRRRPIAEYVVRQFLVAGRYRPLGLLAARLSLGPVWRPPTAAP